MPSFLERSLQIVDRVGGFYLQCDGLAGERLHEDLYAVAEVQPPVKRALLMDAVLRRRAAVLEQPVVQVQALLLGANTLFVMDLSLHIVDCVGRFNVNCEGLAGGGLHVCLHAAKEA